MLLRLLGALRRRPGAVIALIVALAASACGYTSEYVMPAADGRARPVWRDSDVAIETGGLQPTPDCWNEVGRATGSMVQQDGQLVNVVSAPPAAYWAPRYYGPPIVVLVPGLVPRLPHPPLFLPRLVLNAFRSSPRPSMSTPSLRAPSLGRGGGGGGDWGKAAIVLVVIAIVVVAIIGAYLAFNEPESSASARAIDEVNALNDLTRMPGTACSVASVASVGGAP